MTRENDLSFLLAAMHIIESQLEIYACLYHLYQLYAKQSFYV